MPDPRAVAPPTAEEVLQLLRGVIDPELGGNIVDLGMATGATVTPEGDVKIGVKLTIAGCPLRIADQARRRDPRRRPPRRVRSVHIDWGEMTSEERSRR